MYPWRINVPDIIDLSMNPFRNSNNMMDVLLMRLQHTFIYYRPMVNVFNEIIVPEAPAEEQLFFVSNMTPEVSLTVLKKLL